MIYYTLHTGCWYGP